MFKLADELVHAAAGVAEKTTSNPTLQRFDAAQLARGIDAVKAVVLLLENGQWEFSSGIARQLFEQLVNMEISSRRCRRWRASRVNSATSST